MIKQDRDVAGVISRNRNRTKRLRLNVVLISWLYLVLGCMEVLAEPVFTDVGSDVLALPLMGNGQLPRLDGGAATGDFDGDGDIDIVISTRDDRDLFYRNNGDGTFDEIGQQVGFDIVTDGRAVAAGDIDNDGDLDIYISAFVEPGHYLYINDGQGSFSEQAAIRNAEISGGLRHGRGVAFGDYDKDGYLDIFVAEWQAPWASLNSSGPVSRLLRNRGAAQPGYFDDVTVSAGVVQNNIPGRRVGTFPFTPRFTDLDRDGFPDLVIASDFDESRLYWNNGDGTFTDGTEVAGFGSGRTDMGMATADFNGDGLIDIFTTAIFHDEDSDGVADSLLDGNRLYLNNGDRTFSEVTESYGIRQGYWGWGAIGFDYDNDGDLDIVQTNGFVATPPCPACDDEFPPSTDINALYEHTPTRFYENRGNTNFVDIANQAGMVNLDYSVGVISLDYDKDGDLDLLHMNVNSQPSLFRNDSINDNDWLRIELVSSDSPPKGIGAFITVTPQSGNGKFVREVSASGSWLVQDGSGIIHVGLGDLPEGALVNVQIDWPAGGQQTYTGQTTKRMATYYETVPSSVVVFADKGSPASIQTLGTVSFSATVQGNSENHEFEFWVGSPDGLWELVRAYDSESTYSWTPPQPGSYVILTRVRNTGTTATHDAQGSMIFEALEHPPISSMIVVANKNSPAHFQSVGEVEFTATAWGGSGNLEYQFWIQPSDGAWIMVQDYSNDNTYSSAPAFPDTFVIHARARNVGSDAEFDIQASRVFEVLEQPSASAVGITADKASPAPIQTLGAVTFTATGSGGSGQYEYQFWIQLPDGSRVMVQDYSSGNTFSSIPEFAGVFTVLVHTRNAGSTSQVDAIGGMIFEILDQPPANTVVVSADKASPALFASIGDVTFTATAQGGSGSYEYLFAVQIANGPEIIVQDYGPANTYVSAPAFSGTFTVISRVRNIGDTTGFDAMGGLLFELLDQPLAGSMTVIADKSSPADFQTVGAVTFTAIAGDGSEDLEYQFWIQPSDGTWIMVQGYSNDNTYTSAPAFPGTFVIHARARIDSSFAEFDAQAMLTFVVITPNNPLAVVSGSGGGSYDLDAEIQIVAEQAAQDYYFSHWSSDGGGSFENKSALVTTFTMPANAVTITASYVPGVAPSDNVSVARRWNEVLMHAIRNDYARPTVHARNLFHISSAMYDSWAVYAEVEDTWLLGNTRQGVSCPYTEAASPIDTEIARAQAISYAAYHIIKHRFATSPGAAEIERDADALMSSLGLDPEDESMDYTSGSASALGNYIAQCYIAFGLNDGANELGQYANTVYLPVNAPLHPELPGNPDITDLNRWQPLSLVEFIDQSGNPVNSTPEFLGAEWGRVAPFALSTEDLTIYNRDESDYWVYHDPGTPPTIEGALADNYKWAFSLVAIWSSHLDPTDGEMIDISPASIGNIGSYPSNFEDYPDFYRTIAGGDSSTGYSTNPVTQLAYEEQLVPRGDYARVLAEFWADGPDSETPPGHWFVILNEVNDHPMLDRKIGGVGAELGALEWDVKGYFALGGAMHDSAIAAWGIKGWYDYIRPISSLRAMAERGQSTDLNLPSHHIDGVPLIDGFIELVAVNDPLAGEVNEHVGKIKFMSWLGPDQIVDPQLDEAGVGWVLAENWWPYQRPSFVTPPFAGYISGHSTYSRAAAEVMTALTGDAFFPGGMSGFDIRKDEFLVFENGPSVDLTLQWATYRDASDQCSLSRIWGGIHPPLDDIPGRLIGVEIGLDAFELATQYFEGLAP